MSKHTPGPWRKGLAMDGLFVEGGGHRVVCRMISPDREDDLRLILAAPEMLDALVMVLEDAAPTASGRYLIDKDTLMAVANAIANAKGEPA